MPTSVSVITTLSAEPRPADQATYTVSAIDPLEKKAEDLIVDRHQSNGMLFDAYFDKPGFRAWFLEYLLGSYEEIRKRHSA